MKFIDIRIMIIIHFVVQSDVKSDRKGLKIIVSSMRNEYKKGCHGWLGQNGNATTTLA